VGTWKRDTTRVSTGGYSYFASGPATPLDQEAARWAPFTIVGTTYLRFDHYFDFESSYDGAVVEYTEDNGTSWTDAGSLFVDNGYTGSISALHGNPLAGREAFTGASSGWWSSRLDLTPLAGRTVKFRFRVGTDDSTASEGWYVDNVEGYTCSPNFGYLRVVTQSAVPATIYVDDKPLDQYGLNWMRVPTGPHTVCGGGVPGYRRFLCEYVQVNAGATTTATLTYAPNGDLRVLTSPAVASTITVDGVPRNDWGLWAEVKPGTYNVCFGKVAGYDPPPCRNVQTFTGGGATTTGTFTPNPNATGPTSSYSTLRVTTSPASSAMVFLDGEEAGPAGAWTNNWGLDWMKIAPGPHRVCIGRSAEYDWRDESSCQSFTVAAGSVFTKAASFAPVGYLRARTIPSTQANITVDGVAMNAYGMWAPKPPGSYLVCFEHLQGFKAPPCEQRTVVANETTEVYGAYDPAT
jgi:hypothetical protein